jgi:hypothetical protein
MATKKIYRTVGVVPPATTEMYQDADGNWMRDGGATWDADRRAWRRTLWKLTDPMYKVKYNDGQEKMLQVAPEICVEPVAPVEPVEQVSEEGGSESGIEIEEGGNPLEEMAPQEPKVVAVQEVPSSWELATEYESSSERPEWDEFMTREIVGVVPIVAPLPQEREDGGDWLAQRVKRAKGIGGVPTVGTFR